MRNRSTFGRFITFEGGEGSGKSTQIRRLAQRMGQQPGVAQVGVMVTREPGGSPVAEKIRTLLVTGQPEDLDPKAELMLITAARIEHIQKRIFPMLRQGGWVLCDRFIDSTLAYQGYGRGMNTEHLKFLNQWASSGLRPDLTFLLDLDPAVGLARTQPRQVSEDHEKEDRFEQEDVAFHQRVCEGFRQLSREDPGRFVVIDARQDADRVENDVWEAVIRAFPNL